MNRILPNEIEIAKIAKAEETEASESANLIKRLDIQSHAALQLALGWTAEVKEKIDELEAKRCSFVDPLRESMAAINGFFKPAIESLKDAESALKNKIAGYSTACVQKRDKLLASVEAAPESERAAIIQASEATEPPKLAGLSIRETWSGSIVDVNALIDWAVSNNRRELLNVDVGSLVAITKAKNCDPGIPGWKAEKKTSVAVTTSKVKK